jgi:6-methylsalicylate decarboxylase
VETRNRRLAGTPSRRQALATLATLGGSALLGGSLRSLEASAGPQNQPGPVAARAMRGTIDVHSHFFPPSLEEVSAQTLAALGQSIGSWTPARAVEAMDRSGVAKSVVSASWRPPLLQMDREKRRALARETNDYAARMAQDHRGRFGQFAFLPMPDVDGSLAEIAYCLDVLKAPGVGLMTSYGNRWQGDSSFEPLLQELNRRKAVAFCHPQPAACCTNLMPGITTQEAILIEFPYDTGRAMVALLVSGSFAKYRDIRWIFCHCGGTLPALSGRIRAKMPQMPPDRVAQFAPNGVDFEFRRQFYETADAAYGPPMAALLNYVQKTQVLFGTDFPYVSIDDNVKELGERKLAPSDMAAIQRGNALRLMPQLA